MSKEGNIQCQKFLLCDTVHFRYYEEEDMSGDWWLDPINSLLQFDSSELTAVGRAYDVPYHELV